MATKRNPAQDLAALTACEAARRIAEGALTSSELVAACLDIIDAQEAEVQAWAFLDRDRAMLEAQERDRRRQRGLPLGPLHGVPVGVKDIIDVKGMPTGNGTPIDEGRRPFADATVIRRLREAGAVILGKTVTTELAYYHPGKTHNPHDPARTPGGSSSGSAAAVAAGMVPLALGSQTNGSVIRPASYCGVVGFKPTFGAVPRTGVLTLAPSLDQLGVFARSIEDATLVEWLMGADGQDLDASENPGPLTATMLAEPPVTPALAVVKTPFWERADAATRDAFGELAPALGEAADEVELPEVFGRGVGWLGGVMAAEMARNLGHYVDRAPEQVSEALRQLIGDGRAMRAPDYLAARDMQRVLRDALDPLFQRFDVIVTPAATGEAPVGLESTGDPTFCSLWTFCGLPALSLPLLTGPSGMPVGVQLVAPRGQDARLLRTARWLVRTLSQEADA
ncbi:amidase [Halomonas sp. NO4]|uniref:amidase n=1 Tax=Halomonas sp. NO4 TaxID=2484813 RepID=UPI0013D168C8|nr:amidase [Halomonas sp. NO4]